MSKQDKIAEIVKRVSKKPAAPDPEESLFDSGYLDSFALTDMVTELEHEFGLKIPDSDLNPRRFESIARIERYLDSKGNLAGA
ncbi:MAG TPA: acyl carrier protein [Bryobacteraceae bacterium]|jgi:acyl carrier protein|nr:acyl carrier protein [Bryobacteraceae bacterium]